MVVPIGNSNVSVAQVTSYCICSWIRIRVQPFHRMVLHAITCFTLLHSLTHWLLHSSHRLHSSHLRHSSHGLHSSHRLHSSHWHATHWLLIHTRHLLLHHRLTESRLLHHGLTIAWLLHHGLLVPHLGLHSHSRLTILLLHSHHWSLSIRLLHSHRSLSKRLLHSHRWLSIRLLHSHHRLLHTHRCSAHWSTSHWWLAIATTLICTNMTSCVRIG